MLQYSDEKKKEWLIDKLIRSGIFKKGNTQLFELPLKELQTEYSNSKAQCGRKD
jgi:Fur-regulated basic protein A